tara:strand:- start:5174 stop:5392 length:219 start_codon:yes stop_codon:yes gene_type:complete
MIRLLFILSIAALIILTFALLTTFLLEKFGKQIAVSIIIATAIIISMIIYAHEDNCVLPGNEDKSLKICWIK